jgi:spore coat protein A
MKGAAVLFLPFGASGCGGLTAGNNSTQGSAGTLLKSAAKLPEPFRVPLPIPPVLEPIRTDATTDYYRITQKISQAEILPDLRTEIWGYDGIFPGPTIVSRSGRRTVVRHRNELPVPTAVHLHGGVTPPEHDGYPSDVVMPSGGWHDGHRGHLELNVIGEGSFDYEYPLEQPAAALWYHDHRMDFTGPQVYKGLAGFHLIHDDVEQALELPARERDVPLMICDRSFARDGSFRYPSLDPSLEGRPGVRAEYMSGVLGDCILVNGAPWPVLEVTNTRYRFRLLNASPRQSALMSSSTSRSTRSVMRSQWSTSLARPAPPRSCGSSWREREEMTAGSPRSWPTSNHCQGRMPLWSGSSASSEAGRR